MTGLMGQVTFDALPGVVVLDDDLLEPFGPGRIGLVAADAMTASKFGRQDVRVFSVFTAYTMTGFAGQCLMFELGELLQLVGMTFVARLLARINQWARTQLHQRFTTIPAKVPE